MSVRPGSDASQPTRRESQPWPRDAFVSAVWQSSLKPLERLVAFCYADHARDGQTAWVTYERLQARTGLSRDALARAIRGLTSAGWLVVERPSGQHASTLYRLTVPAQESASRTAEQSASRTPASRQQSASRHQQSVSRRQQSASRTQLLIDHSHTTLSSAPEEDAVLVDQEERRHDHAEERQAEETFGARALAMLGRSDFTARQLDALYRACEPRVGASLAAPAAIAVARRSKSSPAGYLKQLSDDELRDLAHDELDRSDRTSRVGSPTRPSWCGECYEATRRLEHPDTGQDLGPCPKCHVRTAERRSA